MKQIVKKIFLSNAQIKIISLILGYSFWHIFSQSHVTRIWYEVPISFYKVPKNIQVEAPEKIKIQLSGKRSDLYNIDVKTLAFHINMQDASVGNRIFKLTQKELFLPDSIRLVRCSPANIDIMIKKKQETNMQRNLFGTDGIRGAVGIRPLTHDYIIYLGSAIAAWAQEKYGDSPTILIGHDTRQSCDMIKSALKTGLLLSQVNLYDAGIIPTPAAYVIAKKLKANRSDRFDCAIVISASHNPYQDNGIKIIDAKTGKLSYIDEETITQIFYNNCKKEACYSTLGSDNIFFQAEQKYIEFVTNHFKKDLLKGLKIVLDCAHGATAQVGPAIFEMLGAQVYLIGSSPNGININEQCGSVHPKALQREVLLQKADAGFAFDGDGDRVVAVNALGQIKDGDDILAILHNHPMYQHEKAIVGTILTNYGFEKYLEQRGKKLIRTNVGDKFVVQAMKKQNLLLGGEQSGHIAIRDYLDMGDGIFVALKVMETLIQTGNFQMKTFEKYPQLMVNVPITEKKDLDSGPISELIASYKQNVQNGRIVVRYSGTQNLLRVMVEADTMSVAEKICLNLSNELQKELST